MSPLLAQSGHPNSLHQCPLLGVKRTWCGRTSMSAFDAVDGARPAVSKCYSSRVESESKQGGETTANPGAEALKELARTRRRNADKVDPGIGEPVWVSASLNACFRLGPDPRRALWPAASPPHKQAGHMTAPDQCCSYVRKFLPRRQWYGPPPVQPVECRT